MIQVTIQHKGKQFNVVCNKVVQTNKRQVVCYDYKQEDDKVVSYYNGFIVAVIAV